MLRSVTPAERLLILTLTLEQSLLNGDFEGAEQLLHAREGALGAPFDASDPLEHRRIVDAARVEQRCLAMLQSMKKGVVADLMESFQTRRMAGTYGAAAIESGLDEGH